MGVLEIIGSLLLAVGCLFALTGSVGVLRMPDFYSRLHPAGKSDTLAQGLILVGLALFASQQLVDGLGAEDGHGGHGDEWLGLANIILKLLLLTALLFLTAPTATHAIAKAARLDRYTKLPVDGDPGGSRVAQIVVKGDVEDNLEEAPDQVLDVREESAPPKPEGSQTEEDEDQ
jgi:multicomponent Na+:H+ antiporter subunit G